MAAVLSLNGQAETFGSLNNTLSNDEHQRKVLLRVNQVVTPNDSCHVAKTCPLTDNGSSKSTADVIPDPGYVIKAPASGTGTKVFVNVCKKESIEKPSSAKQVAHGGRSGLSWTIPHSLTEQVISGSQYKQTYRVFDFQVHPDACRMAETNNRFKNMLNELAVASVAGEFLLNLNVRKLQFPKMKYKTVQVISRKKNAPVPRSSSGARSEVSGKGNVLNVSKEHNIELSIDSGNPELPDQEAQPHALVDIAANNNTFSTPEYTVKFSDSEEVPVVNGVVFSQMLVAAIELPLVNSALAVSLDVFEKSLSLTSTGPVRYKLDIDLPCVIDENRSFAKFIKSRRVLHVIMPVLTSSSTCTSSFESTSTLEPGEVVVLKSDADRLEVRYTYIV